MSPDYLDIRLQGRRDKLLVWSEPHRQQKKNLSVVNGICTVTFALVWSEPHRQKKNLNCSEWRLDSHLRFAHATAFSN